ncbi:lysozyme inhibitor LprI family protein [Cupriavidus sp. L7L]|uniref:lysozyme inhibitor LprI family protein n=1 Tax=Cupriavidus sp. L7L TaxID=2546443 RepID=UPI001056DC9A|nr:lysozyme inhibitor LprI family protein [Cupriavidus sp. L7L]TDF66053.1 DUF1311 domain-containing protein [Cupriavidus sp. L7L]
MKKCPFCSEDIQDAAIRCKHCGADIAAAEAAAAEADFEKAFGWGLGVFFGIVGAAIFGFLAYQAFLAGDKGTAIVIGGFAVAFMVAGPLASRIGDAFRQFAMPDYVFARGAADLAAQKAFWQFGPQAIAAVAAFCIMAVGLSKLVPLEDVVNTAFGSGATMKEQVAEVQNEPASPAAAPVQEDKPSDQVAAQQQAVTVPNPSLQAAVQEPAIPAAPAPAPEAKDAPAIAATAPAAPEKTVIEASFDCSKAASKIEKLICSSPQTADADKRLAATYSAAKAKSADVNSLKAQQVEWMKQERNACTDSACLLKAVDDRIQKLSAS